MDRFVLYVQGSHLFKGFSFSILQSHINWIQNYTITKQGEHFGLLQIAPFYETRTLV